MKFITGRDALIMHDEVYYGPWCFDNAWWMQARAASPAGLRWMLMRWYGQILGGTQLSLIVLSLAPHWPEFSALWANRGSPSRETRPARLTGHRTICWAQSRSRPQAWTRNKLIGQKQRLSASSCTRTAETYSYLEIYHDINNTYKTNPKQRA